MLSVIRAIALVLLLLPSAACAGDTLPHWQILPGKSSIEWIASYGGQEIKGNFPDYKAEIAFDPARPAVSEAVIRIEMAKVKSADHDAEQSLPGKEWFAVAQYPVAVLKSDSFRRIKDDQYEMAAALSLRGRQAKILLPFTAWFYDEDNIHYARIDGETIVKRLEFGIGEGEWAKTDVIADNVKVVIHLEARQAQ